jgi:hypothetical protein
MKQIVFSRLLKYFFALGVGETKSNGSYLGAQDDERLNVNVLKKGSRLSCEKADKNALIQKYISQIYISSLKIAYF